VLSYWFSPASISYRCTAWNNGASNPESGKQWKRAVESGACSPWRVLSGVNLKFISSCAETAHATTRRDFKLWFEILSIRRCASSKKVGGYWSVRAQLLPLFADAINVRPPSSLAAIALYLVPVMMRAPISIVPVESVGTIRAEPRSVVAIARANNHAKYREWSIEDRSRRWWCVIVRRPWSAVRLNHFGAGIRARSRYKAQYKRGGRYHS
jgi:hypothetical protein